MTNNLPDYDFSVLDTLSEKERAYALEILKEYSKRGKSEKLEQLLYEDYKEIPVTIEEFLSNDNYLGKAWKDAAGNSKVYPFWLDTMKKIFPNNIDTDYNTLLETGARGLGKAQPLYSKIMSKDGFINMGDIHIGDEIYGDDGNLHTVTDIFPQGKKDVYEVTFSDGTSTRCSDEHLWTVIQKYNHGREKTLTLNEIMSIGLFSNITKRGVKSARFGIPVTKPLQFHPQEVFIDPYVLGILIGDGALSTGWARFTSYDDEIVNKVNESVGKDGYTLSCYEHSYNIKRIKHSNSANEYCEEIKSMHLAVKSEEKHIPSKYLFNSIDCRIKLLQGLMDSDGYVDKNGYCIFSTVSENLKNDVVFLVQSLGGTAPYRTKHPRYYNSVTDEYRNGQQCYEVTINLPKYIKPVSISRKVARLKESRKEPFRTIRSVEYVGKEECQCILVDSDRHLYLTDDLIVTHNSEVACGMVGAYLMYRVLCLKNPLEYYRLKPTEKIVFAFMNIKLELAEQIAVDKFQKTVQMSPWFMARGRMTQRNNRPYWIPPEPVNIVIGSQSDDVLGQPIFFAFFDEISFIRNQDIDRQKEKAKDMIDTAVGGMVTRFIHNGKNPTMLVVASSKRSEQSFMEEYIKTLSESEGTSVYVVDKPVWEVKPNGTYGDDTFYVGLGNKYLSSIVIPDEDASLLDLYRAKGYKILEVPRFFRAKFLEDIERNLCDIAGISTTSLNKYMSAEIVVNTINEEYRNPFPDIITVGNAPNDLAQYKNFFNMDNIPRELMEKPLFVHLDMSISGDMTGIAGVWIVGKKVTTGGDPARDLFYRVAFSTSVEAPKGYQVSFEKNRNFIRWLREAGFRVKEVTSDTFQSYDLQQQLKAEGFNCSILSVDRVDPSSRVCVPYQHLKSVVYEKRMSMYKSKRLLDEFLDIERNIDNGKIDHSRNGHKDALDAVCGAIFTASKYAEEYAFDYGETLDTIKTVSANHDYASEREQIAVDFQNELNKMFGSSGHSQDNKKSNEKSDGFTDFGFGKSVPLQTQYLANGIVII